MISVSDARVPGSAQLSWALRKALAWCGVFACCGVLMACHRPAAPLPKLGQVGDFELVDQQARPVSAASLRGKVWVAAFFFTRCPTICPRITKRMRALQVATRGQTPAPSLISFSVDPENDTPPVLLEYARRYGADLHSWAFLTGDLRVVKRTIVDGFKLALDGKPDPNAENGGIIHGSHLVLVDQALAIRGYYRTDDEDDMARLVDDAKGLSGP
ncbi:MAG: SCO family protein [Pseudomonadota bacterium]